MSNLSNLFISQSYFGVVNLEDSTQPFTSQSSDVNLQDGVGSNLGIRINPSTQRVTITSSLDVLEDISGSNGRFSGDLYVSGNVHARQVITTIESSSVIFSSGSNIIGDDISDIQTITGQTTISGSLTVIGPHSHTGDFDITGSLFVSNEISSSTIAGLGNATEYSESVDTSLNDLSSSFSASQYIQDQRLDALEADSASQDSRLDNLELFTSSQDTINSGYNTFTQSADQRLDSIEIFSSSYYTDSASFDSRIDALEDFSSSLVTDFVTDTQLTAALADYVTIADYDIDSASFDTRIDSLGTDITNLSSSVDTTIQNQQSEIDALIADTGSYAKLDEDNDFSGSQIITGSVNGNVESITITSLTASIDCSTGNFFTLSLPTGSTHLTATNIVPGQTISLRVNTNTGGRTVEADNNTIKFPVGFEYVASVSSSYDILTFVTFDTESLYGVATNLFRV